MPNLAHTSLSNRRLLSVVAIGAVLAALVLLRGPALPGAAASPRPQAVPKLQAVLANCTAADVHGEETQAFPPVGQVVLQATSTSCVSPQYRYLLLAPGTSTWVFKTGYTSSATYVWDVMGAAVGVWQIGVWARESGSTARYNAYAIGSFNIGYDYCTESLIVPVPVEPQPAGQSVAITGYAQGCTVDPPRFEFWKMAPGSSTWVMVQPYAPGASVTWDTTGAAKGAWRWAVWVKAFYSAHRYDSYAMLTYWIT